MNSTALTIVLGAFIVITTAALGYQTYQLSQLHERLEAISTSAHATAKSNPAETADTNSDHPADTAAKPHSDESETASASPAPTDPALTDPIPPLAGPVDPWSPFALDDGWDPFRDLATMQERMDRLISQSFGRNAEFHPLFDDAPVAAHADISESDDAVHVTIDLPGMTEKAIQLDLSGNQLSVRGERSEEVTESDDQGAYVRRERRFGQVQRSITLSGELDATGMTSTYENGVLHVTVPKKKL